MAEVILFRPRILSEKDRGMHLRPPWGLLYLAAPLVKNNYRVKIIDEEIDLNWQEELSKELDESTICVGVSSLTGRQILGGLRFSKIIKDRSNIPVVWGGAHPSILPEQTIKNELVDIVVQGEGEEPFLKIVHALKQGNSLKGIPNVWYKENNKIYSNLDSQFTDLNNLPPLPYYLLDHEIYLEKNRSYFLDCKRDFEINTDRGCPHRCGFCHIYSICKGEWRAQVPSKVVEHVEYLIKNFKIDGIYFLGDNFFVDKDRVADICLKMIKRKIDLPWRANCRIDYFEKYDDSFIDLLVASSCKVLGFGIESGSERILGLIDKGITLDKVFKVNERLKKKHITPHYYFMVGFPTETKKEALQTYELMMKLYDAYPNSNAVYSVRIYCPYPGTPLHHICEEMGFKSPDNLGGWAKMEWDVSNLPFLSADYTKWLEKSVHTVVNRTFCSPRWIRWWFRIRTRILIKFKAIGPQPEEWLVTFAKIIVRINKKLFKKL